MSVNLYAQKPIVERIAFEEYTTAERDLLTPLTGFATLIYNKTTERFETYNGTSWETLLKPLDLTDYATQLWVSNQSYLVASDISGKANLSGGNTISGEQIFLNDRVIIETDDTSFAGYMFRDNSGNNNYGYVGRNPGGTGQNNNKKGIYLANINDNGIFIQDTNPVNPNSDGSIFHKTTFSQFEMWDARNHRAGIEFLTPTGNGSQLTGLSATNITTGTLADARLSGNVARLNGTNNQNFGSGSAIFGGDATINGITFGKGGGNINTNTANGYFSLFSNTTGSNNTANGYFSLYLNTTGSNNTANGYESGRYISGGIAPNSITDNSVYLGGNTKALANNQTNQVVIGYDATGNGSNTVTIGNSSITDNYFNGNVRGTNFIGNGSQLTGLNATNITTGTLADARLSTNVSLKNATETLTGVKSFSTYIDLSTATNGFVLGNKPNSNKIFYATTEKAFIFVESDNTFAGVRASDLYLPPVNFASLPSGAQLSAGLICTINDASSITYRGTASGGGSDFALVIYDGTNWIYH